MPAPRTSTLIVVGVCTLVLLPALLSLVVSPPDQLEKYRWWFVLPSILVAGVAVWGFVRIVQGADTISFAAERLKRNRQQMIAKVRNDWIKGVLDQSLHRVARVDLGLEERPESVENPLTIVLQEAGTEPQPLPPCTRITTIFDDHAGALLILGAPGGGKTTLLLELARDLLDRAERDDSYHIPVVFNLSSWAAKSLLLDEWLVEELNQRYDVPRKLGQHWLENEALLPLLDGLDEVAEEHRNTCVETINRFRVEHGLTPIAVCSREADYGKLTHRLRLPGAVLIQPLKRTEVEDYLRLAKDRLDGLRMALESDPLLWELLDTPLMLSVAMLAYQGSGLVKGLTGADLSQQRHDLFARYVEKMFSRRSSGKQYSHRQSIVWLAWLAYFMTQFGQNAFHLEALNIDWLRFDRQRRLLNLTRGFALGLILWIGVLLAMVRELHQLKPTVPLTASVVTGLLLAGFRTLVTIYPKPVESLRWSWSRIKAGSGALLVVAVISAGLLVFSYSGMIESSFAVRAVSALALVYVVVVGTEGLTIRDLSLADVPNGGTRRSGWTALIGGCFFYVVAGICACIYIYAWSLDISSSLFAALVVPSIPFMLARGGFFFIDHWTTRLLLWCYNYAPLRYVRFLDYAAERIFLRKVGGGYIFIHRMLMEYFASLWDEGKGRLKSDTT